MDCSSGLVRPPIRKAWWRFAREPLLRGAADLWILSDPVTQSDVVAVFGGGLPLRPLVAAELY
jgi:hypothetical protein